VLEELLQKQQRDFTDALNKQAAAQRDATDTAERALKTQLTTRPTPTRPITRRWRKA
jgi:hypothetical protein